MLKVIYADERLDEIHSIIHQLDSEQFYFISRYLEQERKNRQAAIFAQWQTFLHDTLQSNLSS